MADSNEKTTPGNVDTRVDEFASNDTLADELLAIKCQLGDRAALNALVERWHPSLWQYVRRWSRNPEASAEIVQDAWLRILRALPTLRDPAKLRTWLFGITRRTVMDHLRMEYAKPPGGDVAIDTIANPDNDDDWSDELSVMHEALSELPDVEREVLTLFYLRELSLQQLADVLDVPVGTIKSRLFRARHLLRTAFSTKDQTR